MLIRQITSRVLLYVVISAALGTQLRAQSAASQAAQTTSPEQLAAASGKHQSTGIVISLTDTGMVIARGRGKQKTNWSFLRNEKTKTTGILNRNCKVTVYYHEEFGKRIADRVKVIEPATPASSTVKQSTSKPKT